MKSLFRALLVLLIWIFCGLSLRAQFVHPPKYEYRAVWLATIKGLDWPKKEHRGDYAAQQTHLRAILDSLQAININTILLQTRVRGDVIYPSEIEPFVPVFTGHHGVGPDYDPLAFAIDECHRRGMQLHAWLVTIPLGEVQYVKGHGKCSLPARKLGYCTRFKGAWYMEPSHPATAEHLGALVEEITACYDIDGIHFDYIRYPEYSDAYPDASFYSQNRCGMNKADWRRANITHLMRTLYNRVKALKPWVCVSAATLGKHDDVARYGSYGWNAYHTVYQEAQSWMREGCIDAIFPMIYYTDNHFYPFVCDWGEHSCGRHVVAGMGTYQLHPNEKDWSIEELVRQLHVVRVHPRVAGAAQFRSQFVTGNVKGIYELLRYLYPYPALVPPMSWMGVVHPSAPQNLEAAVSKQTLMLTWQATDSLRYNVYSSTTFPVDTSNPANLVATCLIGSSYIEHLPSLAQPRHYAVTAMDRFGGESDPAQWQNGNLPICPKKF